MCPSAHTASSIPLSKVVLIVRVSKSPPKAQRPGPRAESLARWEDLASARVTDSAMSSPRVSSPSGPVALALLRSLVPSLPLPPRSALCFCLTRAPPSPALPSRAQLLAALPLPSHPAGANETLSCLRGHRHPAPGPEGSCLSQRSRRLCPPLHRLPCPQWPPVRNESSRPKIHGCSPGVSPPLAGGCRSSPELSMGANAAGRRGLPRWHHAALTVPLGTAGQTLPGRWAPVPVLPCPPHRLPCCMCMCCSPGAPPAQRWANREALLHGSGTRVHGGKFFFMSCAEPSGPG